MHYCSQEKETGALLFLGETNWSTFVLKEKETGALLFSRRRKLEHYCSQGEGTGALLFSGEGNWCSTVFRRDKLEHYCSQGEGNWCTIVLKEKETGVLLFSGDCSQERKKKKKKKKKKKWCTTTVLKCLCFQEKGTGAQLFLGQGR